MYINPPEHCYLHAHINTHTYIYTYTYTYVKHIQKRIGTYGLPQSAERKDTIGGDPKAREEAARKGCCREGVPQEQLRLITYYENWRK